MVMWLPALLLAAFAHPLHTSVTELRYEARTGAVEISIRVYGDDLAAVVPETAGPAAEAAISRYARERFRLVDRSGRVVALAWVGAEHVADAVVLRLRAGLPGGLRGARVGATLLQERFADQVNVVRASDGGHTATLLFLRGDATKTVP